MYKQGEDFLVIHVSDIVESQGMCIASWSPPQFLLRFVASNAGVTLFFHRPKPEEDTTQEDEFELQSQHVRPERTESENVQWLQSLLLFSICWSFGGTLDGDSRVR